jgi:peptidoglycan/LPS O-acetylase OafA/YrhL
MANERARWMNLIALALLSTAVIAFGAFHFLKVQTYVDPGLMGQPEELGWSIWVEVYEFLKSPDPDEFQPMIGVASLLASTVLVIACPLLVPVLSRSRLAWWVAVLASGSAMCGLGGILLFGQGDPDYSVPGPAIWCLLGVLVLNFTGLLFIRREAAAPAKLDPQPEP